MRVWQLLWLSWIVYFLVLETIAVFDKRPDNTLTQTILHAVPWEVILLFLGWLTIHFTSRVWRNRHGRQEGL